MTSDGTKKVGFVPNQSYIWIMFTGGFKKILKAKIKKIEQIKKIVKFENLGELKN